MMSWILALASLAFCALLFFRLRTLGSGLGVTRICAMWTVGSAGLNIALLAL